MFTAKFPTLEKANAQWKKMIGPGLEEGVLDAAAETAPELVEQIKEAAAQAGEDWVTQANKIEIKRDDDSVRLELPRASFDMEHGDEQTPPRPVVRTTVSKNWKTNSYAFTRRIGKHLEGR